MQLCVVENLKDGSEVIVSLEKASLITSPDEAEIELAHGEYGICETETLFIYEGLRVFPPLPTSFEVVLLR